MQQDSVADYIFDEPQSGALSSLLKTEVFLTNPIAELRTLSKVRQAG